MVGSPSVQRTLKSLFQHHSSKASILQHSVLFTVQLSHPYMTPGKTTALTRWTFVGKVMSLLFNMLSMLVITFSHRYTYFPSLLKLPSTSHPWHWARWTLFEFVKLPKFNKMETGRTDVYLWLCLFSKVKCISYLIWYGVRYLQRVMVRGPCMFLRCINLY